MSVVYPQFGSATPQQQQNNTGDPAIWLKLFQKMGLIDKGSDLVPSFLQGGSVGNWMSQLLDQMAPDRRPPGGDGSP